MSYSIPHLCTSLTALLIAVAPAALAQVPRIVTDLPVTHALTAIVTEGVAQPVLLLESGANAHDFALRPSQARAVSEAGLVVWMGASMTPWMDRAVDALAPSAHMDLLSVPGLHLQPYRAQVLFGAEADSGQSDDHADHDEGHDSDHGHAHGQGHGHGHGQGHAHGHDDNDHTPEDAPEHAHDHGDGIDPHAWLAIDNALTWLDAIAGNLARIDPANAETYAANAQAGRARLVALDIEIRALLASVGSTGLIVHHDAFGYLAQAYGLNILGSVALGDAAAPGAARLSAIRAALTEAGAVCIFPEVNHSDAHVRLIAQGTDLRIGAPLDPEGVSLDPGPDLYETLMRNLATAIADCATRS